MGSLISPPKAPQPQTPRVVYVPQTSSSGPAPSSPTSTPSNTLSAVENGAAGGGSGGSTATDGQAQEQATQQQREKNLLSRSRGKISTVLTGFRGVLSDTVNGGDRKTLLGE